MTALPPAAAVALYATLAWSPLATFAAERIGASLPVAVSADWPSECALQPPPELRPT